MTDTFQRGAVRDASVIVARDTDGKVAVLSAEFPQHGGEYMFLSVCAALGPEYPIVLAARQLFSRTRSALGDVDAGIELMTDVVARRERGLGTEHPFTVASRQLLDAYRSGRWCPPRPPGG